MNFVLDASVTMSWLLRDGKPAANDYAGEVLDAVVSQDLQPIVPVTWGLEVANVIAKAEARELVTQAQSEAFLEMLNDLGILVDFETFPKSLGETLQLARRYRLSSYDSSYLEIALREGLRLATLDADLRKAAKKAGVTLLSPQ